MTPRLPVLLLLCAASASCLSPRSRRFAAYQFSGPKPPTECAAEGPARWCVHAPKGASDDVVYFFHYATGDEGSFNRLGLSRAFYDEWRRLKKAPPRVVSVSYGTHWVLTGTPGLHQFVLLPDFAALRARIEASLGKVGRRFAWGMSMGGYNAAEAVLTEPGTWSAAALSCPALYAESPYVKPQAEPWKRGPEGRDMFVYRLAGDAAWRAENPLARAAAAKNVPPFWIELNPDDEFGFAEGGRALAKALNARAVETPGGHCRIDARAAARFLAALP